MNIIANFLRGLGVVLPVALTAWLIVWLIGGAEMLLRRTVFVLLPDTLYFPGLGIALACLIIYGVGVLLQFFFINRFWSWLETRLKHVPIVKTIYTSVSDLFGFFTSNIASHTSRVVGVDLGEDTRLVGFITDNSPHAFGPPGEQRIAVYVPMSYQIGGFTLLVPREKVEILDMSVEEAMRFILTAGIQRNDEYRP
jgi:uncharacterized membrane protein